MWENLEQSSARSTTGTYSVAFVKDVLADGVRDKLCVVKKMPSLQTPEAKQCSAITSFEDLPILLLHKGIDLYIKSLQKRNSLSLTALHNLTVSLQCTSGSKNEEPSHRS